MRRALQILGWLALAGTILPPVLYLAGHVELRQSQAWLLAATGVWFLVGLLRYQRDAD